MKACKVCDCARHKSYGVSVSSLQQLKSKGWEALGLNPDAAVTVVLEEDGTVVEDEAYFLCLPSNTKFMLLNEKERWCGKAKVDGGTVWMMGGSVEQDVDTVDHGVPATPHWHSLACRLKQNLTSVIVMSEAELQSLGEVPCSELAQVLGFPDSQARALQDALQGTLDLREEERQSRELLRLYLQAVGKESSRNDEASGGSVGDETDGGSSGDLGFSARTLMVLKGKSSPETRLSNQELQMVVTTGSASMAALLGWDAGRTDALLQACDEQLCSRQEQVCAAQSLRAHTEADENKAKRRK